MKLESAGGGGGIHKTIVKSFLLSAVRPRFRGAVSLSNTKQLRDSKEKWQGNYEMQLTPNTHFFF